MSAPTIDRLASEVTVSIVGTGSFLPERRVGNAEMLDRIRPARPDGRLIEPEWVDTHLGIHERRLDYAFGTDGKHSRAEGGIYDGDLAVRASQAALADAGITGADVDLLVHVTSTPDTTSCQDHLRFITQELGLRRDVELVHHNLGCAGLAAGLRTAAASLVATAPATALVVATNCPSGYFGPDQHDRYINHPSGLAWVSALMFSDGGGAAVLRSSHRDTDGDPRGLLGVRYETSPDDELVIYPAGGCLNRTQQANLDEHVFIMHARRVAEVFPTLMLRDMEMLQEDWPTVVKPAVGADFDPDLVTRWYLHQANGVVIRKAIELLDLPADKVPIGVDHYGNTSAASTFVLLDEDRRAGRVGPGDLVAFLWLGAGNGAMNGYAAAIL